MRYTLLVGGLSNMAFNSALYSKLVYDPHQDFVPVALVYKFGYVMGRRICATKLQDIVAAAKANRARSRVATAGVGTGQQLVSRRVHEAAGVSFWKCLTRARAGAVCRGRIDLFFDSDCGGLPYVQSGQARGIAVLSSSAVRFALTCRHVGGCVPVSMSILGWISHRKNPAGDYRKVAGGYPRSLPDLKEAL